MVLSGITEVLQRNNNDFIAVAMGINMATRKNTTLLREIYKITLPYYRQQISFTHQKVADYLGVNRCTYTAWEIGKSVPDTWTIKLLAELYGITMEDLLNTDKTKTSNDDNYQNINE